MPAEAEKHRRQLQKNNSRFKTCGTPEDPKWRLIRSSCQFSSKQLHKSAATAKSSADAGTGRQVVTCCHLVDVFRQRGHFRTHLSLFSRNYRIMFDRVLLKIFKLDDIKPAAVDKMKKRKRESKNSAAVSPAATGCRSANMLRFQEVKVK